MEAKEFIVQHHYSRGSAYRPSPCYGLFDGDNLIGCLMIAVPCSERVRASVFGIEYKNHVKELHRLAIIDDTPKNTESWFISRCLKLLREDDERLWALVSFADPTQGHEGVIYKASNAYYYGRSSKSRFYLDGEGGLRHPRQCGVNISMKAAKEKGWEPVMREGKHRYLFILGNKSQKRNRRKMVIV